MRDRREFPPKVMVAAFQRCAGKCEGCGAKLYTGKFAYDHRIPDAMGGEPILSNCDVLCAACHGAKTHRIDVPAIAKVKRIGAKHIGIRKPPAFRSKWKRKINGSTVLREAT